MFYRQLSKPIESVPPPEMICPKCNPLAGCFVGGCPCTHDGFILYPGRYPLNPIRPKWCPKCVSKCPLNAIHCPKRYRQCTDQQISTYKCFEEIPSKE